MAQLPPKIPSMPQNWPCFPHQRLPPDTITPNPSHHQQEQPCWMDEFLDYSAVRRGSHRRSASDSIAFLEVEECRNQHMMNGGFDRLDDEQLMSMFSDDHINIPMTMPPSLSSSNPSTPSDQHSNNDEKPTPMELQQPKHEPGEVESSCKTEPQQSFTAQPYAAACNNTSATNDTFLDPKRVKRILANRQSAQRSRVRKLQYISELERSVTTLQTEVSVLSPRVAFLDHQRLILNVDNSAIKQRIAALAQDKIFKEAHQEALRKEIERLRQVYHQQNLKQMNDNAPPNSEAMGCTDNEMLSNLGG